MISEDDFYTTLKTNSIDKYICLNYIILPFYHNNMVVYLTVIKKYDCSLVIKIDNNFVNKITFDVKLIFPLIITSIPNRFLSGII
jgi:hypothetical protein